MVHLLAMYKKEREGKDAYITEHGFAIYLIKGEECYIEDIYVRPEYRRNKFGLEIAQEVEKIAKTHGCKVLTGTIYPDMGDATASMKALLFFGMKIMSAKENVIFMVKEI